MIYNLLKHIKNFFHSMQSLEKPVYRIISIDDSYQESKKVYARVQVVGTSNAFDCPVSELYQKQWLDQFAKEDVAHIAALYTAEHMNNLSLIERFPKKNSTVKSGVFVVGILFTACLILSNLAAVKLAQIGNFIFPAALIFFPMTYIFDDILTEVYGFKISRRIIWTGLLANLIVIIGMWLTTYLPAANAWTHASAYNDMYRMTPQIFIASIFGYLFGEFSNSILLAKLKILTVGRHLWLRALTSSIIGVGIDTIVFVHIAFIFTLTYSALWHVIVNVYLVKMIYEICALPITYKVTNYLKHKDNVDHYDFNTRFNPFSIAT